MSDIEKEARRQALEELPDYLTPPFDELKIVRFVLAKMGYDEKEMRAEVEAESARVLELEAARIEEELEHKSEHVKGLLLGRHYPEKIKSKYESGYAVGRGEDNSPVFTGYEEPKRIRWNAVIKDGHPDSGLKFKLMDWVNSMPWWDYWDPEDYRILAKFDREFVDRSHVTAYLHNPELNHSWTVQIMIRRKEGD